MEGHHTFTATKFFGAEMEGQGEFEFEVTTQNTGSFEWTLRTEHDEDAYENWDNLWADIEMEVEEQVSSRWEDELDPGYGGHNPGFGDGFEVTLDLTEAMFAKHGVDQEYAWVDWTASSSSPWYSAEGAETETFESPVSCKICGKTFDSFRGLNGHMNAHPLRWTHRGRNRAEGRAYPYQVFNSTSKAHAEKVAHLVPGSIVKRSGDWVVMSKTPYAEARSYFEPWLKENDYFRTNQFLSEVKYEAESFNADTFHSFRNTRKTRRPFATARINPMPKIDEEVGCMSCLWGGKKKDLQGLLCPECDSDNVIDLTHQYKYAEDRDEDERMTRPEAEALADKVVKLVTPYVDRVEVCGSYRRGSPRPGDLDVVIIPKKGVTLPEIVKAIKPTEVHWMGEKKAQVLIDDHNVDFRTSSPKGWGAALLYFTGPAGYNIGMRVRAKKRGMKLNEYGIFDRTTNAYLGGATEDEIYTVLGKTLKLPAMRAESVGNNCSYCGAKGELITLPTQQGQMRSFCGPVCLYDWRGKQRLAADEVFEAPRAAFTNAAQAVWEKSYDIKAKKPLNKFLKERMGGQKPSDDSKKWSYTDHVATDVTKEEAKLIQGYASVMKMCESRFNATNDFRDEVAYKSVTNAREAYATSWKPKARMSGVPRPYLEQAVTDLHALAALDKKGRTAYMAKDANDFKNSRLPLMREFLRYYDMTMTPGGPYKDIRMVATDRAPYRTTGGYGAVNYHTRNPYAFGDKPVVDVFSYDKKTKKLTIGSERSEGALFTRMTKMRPYRHCPMITDDDNSSVEYDTDGGSGWSRRSYGSQSFSLTPVLLRNPGGYLKRNPDPDSYATSNQEGWRWNVTDWETRKSAPYRYATMVSIPNGEDLQRIYTGGTADATSERYPSAQGGKVLSRNEIVDTINFCAPLLDAALKQQAYIRVTQERKEEKVRALTVKNQAATDLEMVSSQMVDLLKAQVAAARHAGVSDVEIYETLEMTQYDLELMVQDWEPSDYMAESRFGRNHGGS